MGTYQLFPALELATAVGQFCFRQPHTRFPTSPTSVYPVYLPLPLLSNVGHDVIDVGFVLRPNVLRPVCPRVRASFTLAARQTDE